MGKTEKKRKWERDYEQYLNSTELDERLGELEEKINGEKRAATREEYDEHKKLIAIKANLPKVKNILELRAKLEEKRNEIKAEIETREILIQKNKECQKLDDELNGKIVEKDGKKVQIDGLKQKREKLNEQLSDLKSKLANPNLDSAEKSRLEADKIKLQNEISDNEKKIQDNNKEFGNKQEEIKKAQATIVKSKFKDISLENLKNTAIKISSNISKCNLACNKLMQGFSWQSIEVALDKYEGEKLTAKGKNAAKMKQNREALNVSNAKKQESKLTSKSEDADEKGKNSIATLTRWQRVKNWTKATWEKIKEQLVNDEEQEVSEDVVESEPETKPTFWQRVKNWFKEDESNEKSEKGKGSSVKTKSEKSGQETGKEDSFRQYLRDVAEKGMAGVEQEKTEARMKSAREKLEANRAEALRREAERDQKNKDAR